MGIQLRCDNSCLRHFDYIVLKSSTFLCGYTHTEAQDKRKICLWRVLTDSLSVQSEALPAG